MRLKVLIEFYVGRTLDLTPLNKQVICQRLLSNST